MVVSTDSFTRVQKWKAFHDMKGRVYVRFSPELTCQPSAHALDDAQMCPAMAMEQILTVNP